MNILTEFSWSPRTTPGIIKQLIITICIASLLSGTIQAIFERFEWYPGPEDILSLSWNGISHGYIWQPLTYFFIQNFSSPLSLPYLVSLFFSIYVLWVIGTALLDMIEKKHFLFLYLISGILSGLFGLIMMPLSGQYMMLAGLTAPLLTLFVLWGIAFSELKTLLFFLIPLKIKWLALTVTSLILLSDLSQWNLPYFMLSLSAIVIGYGYAICVMGWHSPFSFTEKFDKKLALFGFSLVRYCPRWLRTTLSNTSTGSGSSKIIDVDTGKEPLSDNSFVEAMLEKISKEGEDSLSWNERQRLQAISEKKLHE